MLSAGSLLERVGLAVVLLAALSSAYAAPLFIDSEAEISVNGLYLGDSPEVVLKKLGRPQEIKIARDATNSNRSYIWTYADQRAKFTNRFLVAIVGNSCEQQGKTLAKVRLKNEDFLRAIGSLKSDGFRSFQFTHSVYAGALKKGVPATLFAECKQSNIVSFSIAESQSIGPDFNPSLDGASFTNSKEKPSLCNNDLDRVDVLVTASTGEFELELFPQINPEATERVLSLIRARFYDDTPICRVWPECLVEFGINSRGDFPKLQHRYSYPIMEIPRFALEPGTVALMGGTYIRINLQDIPNEDLDWPLVIGRVTRGLDAIRSLVAQDVVGNGDVYDELWRGDKRLIGGFRPERIVSVKIVSQ